MGRRRQVAVGSALLAAGLVTVAVGTAYPSTDARVALDCLLVLPMLVSLCGIVFLVAALARRSGGATRPAPVATIIGVSAASGLGLALGFGAAGVLSQVPDWLAGLNGPYIPGSAAGAGVFVLAGIGLSAGLLIGAVAAVIWWVYRGRQSIHP